MNVLVAGPDVDGIGEALGALGVDVVRVDGLANRDSLLEAGVDSADVLVLTDMNDASAIPVAKEENPDIRVVTYTRDSLPEFVRGQTDLAVDPELLSADVVAEELAGA
jgi:Trk K+ transport system NAD-binding subunit